MAEQVAEDWIVDGKWLHQEEIRSHGPNGNRCIFILNDIKDKITHNKSALQGN